MIERMQNFVEHLAEVDYLLNVFNQYSYLHEENSIRRRNLLLYLRQMELLNPRILLVGEAPGYQGCRLTGVPFTSEYILLKGIKEPCWDS